MTAVRPLRIALPLESDGPGGAETMLMQLADELRRRGHHVVPIGPATGCGWLGGEFRKKGYEPETFLLRRALDPACLTGMVRLLREKRIELVHSHEFTMTVYGAAAARLVGVPHVSTMHGSQSMLKAARRRAALRVAFAMSRSVVAVSTATRDHLVETLGLPPARIQVIPNGIRFVPGERGRVRAELGLGADDLLVVAVGSLVERKGHAVLLRALARLDREGLPRNWHVAIAGRGELEEPLKALVRELGLEGRAHILGHRGDVADILAASDVFTMPSLWEGLPVAMLEAMFAEKPVIASACSGIPEAITSGVHGLLVPPGDEATLAEALRAVLTGPDLRTALGTAGRDRAAERYSVASMVDAYEVAYGMRSLAVPA
ncbi:MAG TPA: glycosyltransferase family 4 protein [Gemmatimonadales bacterium]|nr:glycosyltransferase family 4 protein [Gemmatimonadales bacterium]